MKFGYIYQCYKFLIQIISRQQWKEQKRIRILKPKQLERITLQACMTKNK